jgi:hypothetical protein
MHAPCGAQGESREHVPGSLQKSKRDPEILSEIITGAGLWVYGYNPETNGITNFQSLLFTCV